MPSLLSANSVTILGQLPLQLMVVAMIALYGTNIGDVEKPVPAALMVLSGCAIQWFSLLDIMDGNRARRLKCGSPLGRLVDEAGDTITQSNYCVLLAYIF